MKNIAQYIDSTNLNPTASRNEIKKIVDDAIEYNFAGVCITPGWATFAKKRLISKNATHIKVITVPNWKVGGGLDSCEGIWEDACESCDEIDYIWNIIHFGDLKDWEKIKKELKIIRGKTKGKLKIIIEAYYLRQMDEKMYKVGIRKIFKEACDLVNASGADYIKTDSGLFKRPDFDSLIEDCKILKKYSRLPIKAAGGIRNRFHATELIKLGVKRIGTSKAVDIVTNTIDI